MTFTACCDRAIIIRVNKNGRSAWHTVYDALTVRDAVEQVFGVNVYQYDKKGDILIFDDLRDDVYQLYAGYTAPKGA
jgi:hypothetical protein